MDSGAPISALIAFTAGLVSFLSPCVLPLIPAYLGYLSGTSLQVLAGGPAGVAPSGAKEAIEPGPRESSRRGIARKVFLNSLSFVLGFSVVFVILGLSASTLGGLLLRYQEPLRKLSGILVFVFGLQMTGIINLSLLAREMRVHNLPKGGTLLSSFLIGTAFSFGWTPCVGPVLASLLLYAGTSGTQLQGAMLLGVYSLGLAIPFLLTALFFERFLGFLPRISRHLPVISTAGGVLLMLVGVLIYFDALAGLQRLF